MSHLTGERLFVIIVILLGWSSFSLADTITKHLSETYNPSLILTFSGVFGTILMASIILIKKGVKGFYSPKWKWLVGRGVCIAFTATGVVNALALIPISDLYGITFSAPFFTVVLATMFLKEEVGKHRWTAVIAGFIGVVILVGPQFNELNMGIFFALMAMITIAIGTIVIRKVGKDVFLPLFLLYPYLGILSVNAPIAVSHLQAVPWNDFLLLMATSVFVLSGQALTTYAIAHANSTASVAPFVYIQVIWGFLFGYFFFDHIPTWTSAIGIAIIVAAGLYMIWRERQLSRQNTVRETY